MAGVSIRIAVSKGGGDLLGEVNASLTELFDNAKDRMRIVLQPGACDICEANEDPLAIPLHPNCRCRPEEIRDADGQTRVPAA